ncbi:MAG: Flp pilus assembly protein CpaB [Actinomycetota bacterium]
MKNRLGLIARQKAFSIIFIAAALLVGILMFWYIGDLKSRITSPGQMQQVMIASTDIEAGYAISGDMVQAQQIPEEVFSERAIRDMDEIVGREAGQKINKGEIIYARHVSGYEDEGFSGFSSYIPRAMRAVTVPVTFHGQDGFLQVGESVDIISTYYDREKGDMAALTILEQKEIMHIGSRQEDRQEYGLLSEEGPSNDFGGQNLLTVTFYLSPEEAESLFLAAQRGIINISICPYQKYNY